MLNREKIMQLMTELNARLARLDVRAEVGIVGGAAMCVVFKSRVSTKDVDAIFEPASILRKIIRELAEEHNLPHDWLNDAAKGFMPKTPHKEEILSLTHLSLWSPEPSYILAMKCISARWDTADRADVEFLIRHLNLQNLPEVTSMIEDYYPRSQIPAKTLFFLEEIFDS